MTNDIKAIEDTLKYINGVAFALCDATHEQTIRQCLEVQLEIVKGGKVVVPKTPTDEMTKAGIQSYYADNNKDEHNVVRRYKAMIKTA